MKNCPYCFAQNPDDSIFCLSCGQNMSTAQAPQAPQVAQDPNIYSQPQQVPPAYAPPQQPVQGGFTPPPQPYAPPAYQAPQQYPAPVPAGPKPAKVGNASKNWAGVMGMILGILSLVLCCIPYLSPFLGVGGLIFSIMGLKSQKKGMAVAGLITSIIGTIIALIYVIILVFALSMPSWLEDIPGFSYSFNESLF